MQNIRAFKELRDRTASGGMSETDPQITAVPVSHPSAAAPGLLKPADPREIVAENTAATGVGAWWPHGRILAGILALGLLAQWALRFVPLSTLSGGSGFVQYLSNNLTVLVTGFGFAIYGCMINRRLRLQLRLQEELGPYTLKELLGSGGMGDVYLAEHRLLKRLCAIKLVRRDKADSAQLIRCFEDEVKATAQLTHWNTVQVYDYGRTHAGTFYYAMEYLRGLNLRQLVDQFGPQAPGRVVFILKQICASLHEAALNGLVHRDIKPSNIFLTERGQMYDVAKLLDFGLVRPSCDQGFQIRNARHQLQGSPRYMCPEQARGLSPDCRGDLYSLGCVAYFLLAGHPPFDERNPVLLVVAHGTTPAPTFAEIGVSVPADLSAVIMKCLNKHPDDRYQSPREFMRALEGCECAESWNWLQAEHWWQEHQARLPSTAADPTEVSCATTPEFPHVGVRMEEPEVTIVGDA